MIARTKHFVLRSLVMLAIVLVMANSLVHHARIDLTERSIHTISTATRDLLARLPNPVVVTYYLSPRLSERFAQPREIIDLLDGYAAAAGGMATVRVVDPAEFGRPGEIESLGIVAQQLEITDRGERRTAIVYSGITVEYLDRRASLPFVFSSTILEYEITSAIANLQRATPRTVAFLIGDPVQTVESTYRFIAAELARSYDVRLVRPGEIIPDGIDVVVATDAHRLSGPDVEALRDYLGRSGTMLAAIEAVDVDPSDGLRARSSFDPPIAELLDEFGIGLGEGLLLDESHNQIQIEEVSAGFRVGRSYSYPHWPAVLTQYTSPDHPVTARFPGLDLYWPTWLTVRPETSAQIIAASTPRAWVMHEPFQLDPRDGRQAGDADHTTGQYGVVAVASADQSSSRVAVVSDSDFLRDDFIQATMSVHNIEFVQNLVQWLANDEDLMEIRTRVTRSLNLDAVPDSMLEATIRFVSYMVNLALVPGGVVLAGIVRWRRRSRLSRAGPTRGDA